MGSYYREIDVIHICIILLLIYLLFHLLLLNRTNNLEMRIGTYCISKRKRLSILNYFYCLYKGVVRLISLFLMKISTFTIYIKQYEKYITRKNRHSVIPADFVSNKILISILFFLSIIGIKQLDGNSINDTDIIIFTLLGYIVPDIYNMIKYNNKQ